MQHAVLPSRLPCCCSDVHERLLPVCSIGARVLLAAAACARHPAGVALLPLAHLQDSLLLLLAPGVVSSKSKALTHIHQHACVLQQISISLQVQLLLVRQPQRRQVDAPAAEQAPGCRSSTAEALVLLLAMVAAAATAAGRRAASLVGLALVGGPAGCCGVAVACMLHAATTPLPSCCCRTVRQRHITVRHVCL
jgi:hypothetical protein